MTDFQSLATYGGGAVGGIETALQKIQGEKAGKGIEPSEYDTDEFDFLGSRQATESSLAKPLEALGIFLVALLFITGGVKTLDGSCAVLAGLAILAGLIFIQAAGLVLFLS